MYILWLGSYCARVIEFIKNNDDKLFITNEPISVDLECVQRAEFIISYGYRHIINKSILEMFPNKAINLHISLLPWNRGADPNFWSFLEDTPKGVSIHLIDEGIDTGDILVQKEVSFKHNETLRTTYEQLSVEIEKLLIENWEKIKNGKIIAQPQLGKGSFHKTKDRVKYELLLKHGWDTPVSILHEQAHCRRRNG